MSALEEDAMGSGGAVTGPLRINGVALRLDPAGALVWPEEALLVVADLHFEKGTSHGARGRFLPPYDSRATLARLEALVRRHRPRRLIALGDSFHDAGAESRLMPDDAARLAALVASTDWLWVSGNHDPDPPAGLGGHACDVVAIGRLVFRHEPLSGRQAGEVAGHLHPAARVGRGRSVRRRAVAADAQRCVLPAFGAYTGGLNVLDAAYDGLFDPERFVAHLLSEGRIYPVRRAGLLPG